MNKRSDMVANIINNLRRVFHAVNEQSKKAEHATGLTGPQLWAIKIIAQEEPIMVSEIARRMYLHPATVVGILDRLEKQGLAVRIRSKIDRRVVEVELTSQGHALVNKSPEVAQGRLVTGLEKLNVNKLINLAHGLDQMVGILGAQNIPRQLIIYSEINRPIKTTAGMIRGKSAIRRRSAKTNTNAQR